MPEEYGKPRIPWAWFLQPAFRLLEAGRAIMVALLAISVCPGCSHKRTPPPDGAALFAQQCASCHAKNNDMRAPERGALHLMSKASILTALDSGRMKWEGKRLSKAKKEAIAAYLAAPETAQSIATGYCPRDLDPPADPPAWAGWGSDVGNRRFQPTRAAGLSRDSVKTLKLKWAFGFPGAAATYGQPTSLWGKTFRRKRRWYCVRA